MVKVNKKQSSSSVSKSLSEKPSKKKNNGKNSDKKKENGRKLQSTEKASCARLLKRPSAEEYFYLKDGTVIKDLYEMADSFERMSDETFYHHVGDMRNDFYNWVKDVFMFEELANRLLACSTKEKHQIELLKYLLNEQKKG